MQPAFSFEAEYSDGRQRLSYHSLSAPLRNVRQKTFTVERNKYLELETTAYGSKGDSVIESASWETVCTPLLHIIARNLVKLTVKLRIFAVLSS